MSQTRKARIRSMAIPAGFRRRSALFAGEVVNTAVAQQAVWVYAVTPRLDPAQLSGLAGVAGERVRAVAAGGVHAIVGSVDASAFGESSMASMLGDLSTIEAIGRAHHQVVAAVAEYHPVVPLRLGTIYPDDATVAALLTEHRAELAELLEFFRGTQEWGVQVYLKPVLEESVPAGVSSGGLELHRSRPQRPWLEAESSADQVDEELSRIALASRRQPAPFLRAGSSSGLMVLNGMYLVDADCAAEFTVTARLLVAEHETLGVELTGPWPPYSFVDRVDRVDG
jgi:hypothetical protein